MGCGKSTAGVSQSLQRDLWRTELDVLMTTGSEELSATNFLRPHYFVGAAGLCLYAQGGPVYQCPDAKVNKCHQKNPECTSPKGDRRGRNQRAGPWSPAPVLLLASRKLAVDWEVAENHAQPTRRHSFSQHFSSTRSLPGTVLGAGALKTFGSVLTPEKP